MIGEDLSEESNGGILRSIQVEGTGYITPNDGSLVKGKNSVNINFYKMVF